MPSLVSFLDLPASVRKEIYSLSGLIRPCPIEISPSKPRSRPDLTENHLGTCYFQAPTRGHRREYNCFCIKIPAQLLVVSRAVYKDVIPILYGHNTIVLRASSGADLIALKSIGSEGLSELSSLLVRLNCWPCARGHEPLRFNGKECRVCGAPACNDQPLNSLVPAGQNIVKSWEAACKHLSSTISLGRLKLTFLCDVVDNVQSAEDVLKPLYALPTLKECTIRLGRAPNTRLSRLAEKTSIGMTRTTPPQGFGFPFERLPRELRLLILRYTHLASPGDYDEKYNFIHIQNSKRLGCTQHYQVSCCEKCTSTSADCCCPTLHASYCAACKYRILPMELFLVNHQVYYDAVEVFFTDANFEFCQGPEETLSFLQRLPKQGLHLLSRLRFYFTTLHLHNWNANEWSKEWTRLVTFMKENLEIEKLSIEMDLTSAYDICLWRDELPNEELNHFMFDIYRDITIDLKSLVGLKDFKIGLGWFMDLKPYLEWEVLGERAIWILAEQEGSRRRDQAVPIWYNVNCPGSGFEDESTYQRGHPMYRSNA